MRMMVDSLRLRLLAITFAAAAMTAACGGDALQSPVGPSSATGTGSALLTADAAAAATAASADRFDALAKGGGGNDKGKDDQGKDKGNDKDNGRDGDDDAVDTPAPDHGKKPAEGDGPGRSHEARAVGIVSAIAGGVLTVDGISVAAGPDAIIRHGNRVLTMADIEVGDHVQARGVMEGTTLVAVEIKVQDVGEGDGDDGEEVEIEGLISGLTSTATCPVVTFTIGTTTVKTSAATQFDDITCAALANNTRVEVEGTRQADGSILATKVEAEAGPDEVLGTVFEFSGAASCPAATFKVGPTLALATTVTTTAATTFSGVTCAALANGARVEVEGTKQANGSIVAASVELR